MTRLYRRLSTRQRIAAAVALPLSLTLGVTAGALPVQATAPERTPAAVNKDEGNHGKPPVLGARVKDTITVKGRTFKDLNANGTLDTLLAMERVEGFFDRHGSKAILVGRFVGIVRAVCPFIAGASKLPLRSFVPYSLVGTAVWASAFTLAGYFFHRSFEEAAQLLSHGAIVVAAVAVIVLVTAHRRGRRRTRASRPAR